MSIKTTQRITKEQAIERITRIMVRIEEAEWCDLYDDITEEDFKDDFVNDFNDLYNFYSKKNTIFKSLEKWPIVELEMFMGTQGIRYNEFENYTIDTKE